MTKLPYETQKLDWSAHSASFWMQKKERKKKTPPDWGKSHSLYSSQSETKTGLSVLHSEKHLGVLN